MNVVVVRKAPVLPPVSHYIVEISTGDAAELMSHSTDVSWSAFKRLQTALRRAAHINSGDG